MQAICLAKCPRCGDRGFETFRNFQACYNCNYSGDSENVWNSFSDHYGVTTGVISEIKRILEREKTSNAEGKT